MAATRAMVRLSAHQKIADAMFAQTTRPTPTVFLCEYHQRVNVTDARERARSALDDAAGGPLGLNRLRELVIGVPDPEPEIARWQTLLDPLEPDATGTWTFPDGPGIRIEHNPGLSQRLVCEVSSLEQAATFLRAEGILDRSDGDELQISPLALAGLDIRIIQAG